MGPELDMIIEDTPLEADTPIIARRQGPGRFGELTHEILQRIPVMPVPGVPRESLCVDQQRGRRREVRLLKQPSKDFLQLDPIQNQRGPVPSPRPEVPSQSMGSGEPNIVQVRPWDISIQIAVDLDRSKRLRRAIPLARDVFPAPQNPSTPTTGQVVLSHSSWQRSGNE